MKGTSLPCTRIPVTNYTPGRHLPIVAVVNHVAEGSREGAIEWFKNPTSQVSSTYFVCKTGELLQFVSEEDTPWTNGVQYSLGYNAYKSDMSIPWISNCWRTHISMNAPCITIEREGFTNEDILPVQWDSIVALHRDILKRYPAITPDRFGVTGHFAVDMITRARCPGLKFNFVKLYELLKAGMPVPSTDEYDNNAWAPIVRGAQWLVDNGDDQDAGDARNMVGILDQNKRRHLGG